MQIESFVKYLGTRKLKFTQERKTILQEMFRSPGHLEVEDLLYSLRRKKKPASRATVYRTLELLVDSGIVRKVDLGHGHSHYELMVDQPHHEHMICLACGKVIEFSDKTMERSLNKLCKKSEFEHTAHRFEIFGYCDKCRKTWQQNESGSKFKSLSS